jgi:hypothetical protein
MYVCGSKLHRTAHGIIGQRITDVDQFAHDERPSWHHCDGRCCRGRRLVPDRSFAFAHLVATEPSSTQDTEQGFDSDAFLRSAHAHAIALDMVESTPRSSCIMTAALDRSRLQLQAVQLRHKKSVTKRYVLHRSQFRVNSAASHCQ